ncbi:hypothetical protein [Pseudoruegeria sp. SHC-113]|uniref:hypothetical protein n=1 Tax=Pseudoruegeria sp. SHC-113 TaxID=2855439 RepID=UPI0021BA9E64|nr:hypothetical protein [Pseudoruegeria sp. SHC-113]MCT8160212.1 hypothetical protein [Pseudoruegeria sp. SHC-113]
MRHAYVLTLAFLLPALHLAQARAELSDLRCEDRARLEAQLQATRAEKVGYGLRDPETLLEVWVTPGNSGWIMVQSYASGTACIVAIGDHWQNLAPPEDPA